MIQKNEVTSKKQSEIHNIGFYCGQRGEGDEIINWNQTSREIFNFVRAICKPGPMARTYCKGEELSINKVTLIEHAPNYISTIGQVVGKTNNGFIVKTIDKTIKVVEYEYEGRINIGDKLRNLQNK